MRKEKERQKGLLISGDLNRAGKLFLRALESKMFKITMVSGSSEGPPYGP